jgi:hypothetical protein
VSRTTITSIDGSGIEARESLRQRHGVRLVEPDEEGAGVRELPDGVYGFTYSPAIAAPLFRTFSYRAFEMHRVSGEALIVGFVSAADAAEIAGGGAPTIRLHHDREGDATTLVVIPYARIARHRQHSVRDTAHLELTLQPEEAR